MSETVEGEARLQELLRIERERNRQMEEALREAKGQLMGWYPDEAVEKALPWIERGLAWRSRQPSEAREPEPEDTSDFYLDSFHRTWNREF